MQNRWLNVWDVLQIVCPIRFFFWKLAHLELAKGIRKKYHIFLELGGSAPSTQLRIRIVLLHTYEIIQSFIYAFRKILWSIEFGFISSISTFQVTFFIPLYQIWENLLPGLRRDKWRTYSAKPAKDNCKVNIFLKVQ